MDMVATLLGHDIRSKPSLMTLSIVLEHVVSLHSYPAWHWSSLLLPLSKLNVCPECFMSTLFCSVSIEIFQHFFTAIYFKVEIIFDQNPRCLIFICLCLF